MSEAFSSHFPVFSLQLTDVACEQDDRVLFRGVSCTVGNGSLIQIGGPNGVGKTTLLRALTTITSDYHGEIRWNGDRLSYGIEDFRRQLLYIAHLPAVKRELSPQENLRFAGALQGRSIDEQAIYRALDQLSIAPYMDFPCDQLSAGQLRRVALARLFLPAPPLWILDEPFTALDVHGVELLTNCFAEHAARGGAVIFTTHQNVPLPGLTLINLADYCGQPNSQLQSPFEVPADE